MDGAVVQALFAHTKPFHPHNYELALIIHYLSAVYVLQLFNATQPVPDAATVQFGI